MIKKSSETNHRRLNNRRNSSEAVELVPFSPSSMIGSLGLGEIKIDRRVRLDKFNEM